MKRFPVVHIYKQADTWSGVTGLELKTVLKADLTMSSVDQDSDHPSALPLVDPRRQARELQAFLHAVVSCLDDIVLELRFLATPNFRIKPQGKILTGILLRTSATDQALIRERLLDRFIQVTTLLNLDFAL